MDNSVLPVMIFQWLITSRNMQSLGGGGGEGEHVSVSFVAIPSRLSLLITATFLLVLCRDQSKRGIFVFYENVLPLSVTKLHQPHF